MDVQDQGEANTTLTVATQDGVDMKFNSAELALSIDKFSERYIEPAVSVMVSGIEGDVLAAMTKAVYNTVGTAGTVPGASSDITVLGNARAKLNQYLAPKDSNRVVQMDSITMASIVNGTKSLFQDSTQIKEAFREGFISRNAMADWYENERTLVTRQRLGRDGHDGLHGPGHGDATAATPPSTCTPRSPVATQVVGEVFTIANVYACHPETKQAYSHLQDFTITAIGASRPRSRRRSTCRARRRTWCKSDGTALATTDFNSADAHLPRLGVHVVSLQPDVPPRRLRVRDRGSPADGRCRLVRAQAVRRPLPARVAGQRHPQRREAHAIDILYGYAALKPEWACRIISTKKGNDMTIATSYEQVTYNSPDGAQMGKSATEKIAFYGSTPLIQRASSVQAASVVSATELHQRHVQLGGILRRSGCNADGAGIVERHGVSAHGPHCRMW
jgi:hypothetical protein